MLKDKVIIITGASSGIGLALVKEFSKNGAKLILAARNIDKLNEIKAELSIINIYIEVIKTDVSIESDCKQLIEFAITKYQKVDILINNAGVSMRALFADLDLDVIRKLMDINFWGTVYCTKYCLPYIIETKGTIVGVSSIAGFKGLPGRTGYSASKFAMNGFLETLRIENLKTGINVLIAAPGFTASNIRKTALAHDGTIQGETPRDEDKMMSSKEVAMHISNAIIKRKKTLILTFQGKMTVFLNKFFPRMLDKMVFNHMAKEENSPIK